MQDCQATPSPIVSPLTFSGSQPRNEARKLEVLESSQVTLTLGGKLAPTHPETPMATATRSRLSPWARGAHQVGSSRFRSPSTSPGDKRQLHCWAAQREGLGGMWSKSAPVLESLVNAGCSQVRPGLGGPFSLSLCSSSVSVFSPGALDLSTGHGCEFHAPSKKRQWCSAQPHLGAGP